MKYLFKISLLAVLMFSTTWVYAQSGVIRGTVIEESNGEPLFGVTVQIKGTTNGAITDFDGKFEIQADPGTYELQASFVSFQTVNVSGVIVNPGETTLIDQLLLKEDVELLEEVVITAEVLKTTEAALLTVKRKSANLIDGISAASFRKIGDSDAASAARRITGVSIEGGRYVYVRGLGDRYTKTLLNGMDVPGLDPDRNTLQMDIFPTNVLDNIIVSKTFTADLPADFTGGMVNIETKDIPDVKTLNAQIGFRYNPSMHFNSDYLTYEGGNTDWLGFDDGTRDLHIADEDVLLRTDVISDPSLSDTYASQLAGFNKTLGAMKQNSFMDYNISASTGNQFGSGIGTLGYNVALTYRNQTEFYEGAQYSRYGIDDADNSVTELQQREFQRGDQGSNNILLGGMLGFALKRDNAKYRINLLKLQNGESRAGIFQYTGSDEGSDFLGLQTNLEYSQRALTNIFVGGDHFFKDTDWQIAWKFSPTISSIDDPDVRFTRYQTDETFAGTFEIGTGESGLPARIWRELNETNYASRIDVIRKYQLGSGEAKLKFGIGNTYKNRDYSIRRFDIVINQNSFNGDFNELFLAENLFPNANGNTYDADFVPLNGNFFESSINNNAIYISNEFNPFTNLKAIIGVRGEDYEQRYTGLGSIDGASISLTDTTVIDEFNLFPTANLIYALKERQNLRFAYTRTIARFSFKEASYAAIFDPLTGRTFLGALSQGFDANGNVIWDGNIQSTLIDNFDLRWEVFQERGQTISISAFYKKFKNAIEVVQSATADNNFQPRNVGDASVYGTEVEFRQELGNFIPSMERFSLNGNVTILDSEIEMSADEIQSRVNIARAGETVANTRDLQGQAPLIINAGLSYAGLSNGLEAGLYYNVQGETLTFTGSADRPDVFSEPFHSLNFSANKTVGENERMRLSFRVNNILGDKRELKYKNFNATDQLFQSLAPGTRLSFSFRYSFL